MMKKSEKRNNVGDAVYCETWDSPFGKMTVCCSEKGVRALDFGKLERSKARANGSRKLGRQPSTRSATLDGQAIAELQEYASGRRKRFTVPLDLQGTSFQLKVWKALLRIPYGETRSYQQIAREVGNARASRAVGMANHFNPVAIMVPCHRVIASDGSLGGYAGGLETKARILRLEQGRAR